MSESFEVISALLLWGVPSMMAFIVGFGLGRCAEEWAGCTRCGHRKAECGRR